MNPYIVYVLTDRAGLIVDITSSDFLRSREGWTAIDEGYGDRYHHAQANYFPGGLMDERGEPRWQLVDGKAVERTKY